MRVLLGIILSMISISVYAIEVTCYSNDKVIYHGYTNDVQYSYEDTLWFKDRNTHKNLVIWSSQCVLKG